MKIRMTPDEIETLRTHLAEFDIFLEFGCGGSTIFALNNSDCRVISVDSDPAWLEKVGEAAGDKADRLSLEFADIGPTRAWGHPVAEIGKDIAARYHAAPWDRVDLSEPILCLVDGRFRLACAVQAILRTRPGSVILFHDFVGREHFEVHSGLLPTVKFVDTMAVLKVTGEEDRAALARLLEDIYASSR